ncbi:MAG: hypothetical protein J6C23_04230 [Clostridia bacterium]|nr:hypothetical protein [Clostridia bacterium]
MKKSWWIIVGAWTGVLIAFFSLSLNVVDMGEMSGGYSAFSPMLVEASTYDKIFPIGLYSTFLIIAFVAGILALAFLVIEEYGIFAKIGNISDKVMHLIKLITGGTILLLGLLVLIFGICFTATLNASMGPGSSFIVYMGGSAFAGFFGALLCGGAIAGSSLLNGGLSLFTKKVVTAEDKNTIEQEVADGRVEEVDAEIVE